MLRKEERATQRLRGPLELRYYQTLLLGGAPPGGAKANE